MIAAATALTFIAKNKVLILIGIIILMAGSITVITNRWLAERDHRKRVVQNSEIEIERFKTKRGEDAVTIQETQLTARELKKSSDSIIQGLLLEANDSRIKRRHLERLLAVKIETKIDSVIIPIHDTTIIREHDTISRIAELKSKWLDVTIAVKVNELEIMSYHKRDKVMIFLVKFKNRKFIGWLFEKWKYRAVIKCEDPNSTIPDVENIKITTKRGR